MGRFPCATAVVASLASACLLASPAFAGAQSTGAPAADVAVKPAPVDPAGRAADVDAVRAEIDRLREELAAVRRQYDDRLLALEDRLVALVAAPRIADVAAQPTPDPPAPAPQDPALTPAQPALGAGANAGKVFNPDTSVIGNFVGVGGKNPFSAQPAMQLTEAEVAFQAIVDPYARADFFLAAGPEGLEVEEGFVTFTALPSNLLLKAGKMRAQFGKVNALHTHGMPTVDRPLVTENLVGGEEGISDSGLSLSRLIHNPLLFLEVTGEVYTGHSAVFQTDQRSHLSYVGRVRGYRDINEDMNLDFGTSVAFGPTEGLASAPVLEGVIGEPSLNRRLAGIDATFRYRPLRRAIYRRLNLRTELIWSRQDLGADLSTTAFGFYGLGEYQFAQRWYAGVRLDRSARAFDASLKDHGGSFFLTFWPTEFSQIRTQYRRTRYAEAVSANELLFQFNFSIGAHGAHAF